MTRTKQRTTLKFRGKAQGVKVNVAKNSYDTASIDITFRVEAPKKPDNPSRYDNSWQAREAQKILDGYGGVKPDPKNDKKGAREFDKAQKILETETQRAQAAADRYACQLAAHAPALMGYAQLVGLMAIFSDQRLVITLEPADQDLLPGMNVMLALPDSKADELGRNGNEDLDDFVADDDLVEAVGAEA